MFLRSTRKIISSYLELNKGETAAETGPAVVLDGAAISQLDLLVLQNSVGGKTLTGTGQ